MRIARNCGRYSFRINASSAVALVAVPSSSEHDTGLPPPPTKGLGPARSQYEQAVATAFAAHRESRDARTDFSRPIPRGVLLLVGPAPDPGATLPRVHLVAQVEIDHDREYCRFRGWIRGEAFVGQIECVPAIRDSDSLVSSHCTRDQSTPRDGPLLSGRFGILPNRCQPGQGGVRPRIFVRHATSPCDY